MAQAPTAHPAVPIAIIGVGCRLPGGSSSPDAFWQLLWEGRDAVIPVPPDRWNIDDLYHPDFGRLGATNQRTGGFIDDIDMFDAAFFGLSGTETLRVDPQHRLLLECAVHALQHAGVTLTDMAGSPTGVFVGISSHDYSDMQTQASERMNGGQHTNQGGAQSIASNRVSYLLDLRGPSVSIDTACSSALYALHYAVTCLRNGDCEQALVGGVNALLRPELTLGFSLGGFLSSRGRCAAFDASADGFVRAEGAGMLVLKPLPRAMTDGDRVLAVIREIGVNEDGRTGGMSLPSQEAQEAMLGAVLKRSGIDPHTVDYVEAHGTGTQAGDRAEAGSLGAVLGHGRPSDRPLLVGSVKTNVGHLEGGSGIAGLIKLVLAMHHQKLPASLHCNEPNPDIDFEELRVQVVRSARDWPANGTRPARAGINSFGFGGANAHALLEAAPDVSGSAARAEGAALVMLSARSKAALEELAGDYQQWIEDRPDLNVMDVAWSEQELRDDFPHRLGIVARDREQFLRGLQSFRDGSQVSGVCFGRAPRQPKGRLAFVFSGQGSQSPGMGLRLYEENSVYRERFDECDALHQRIAGWSLVDELRRDGDSTRIHDTAITQPCLFALQVSLAACWDAMGIVPDGVVGHSSGEMAAAVLCGALSLEEGVLLAHSRGLLEQAVAGGRMTAVGIDEERAKRLVAELGSGLAVALVNRPGLVVLAGHIPALEKAEARCEAEGWFYKRLRTQVAFHSEQMEPIREASLNQLGGYIGSPGDVACYSSVTAARLECFDRTYWWRTIRDTVRFAGAIQSMIDDGYGSFIEVAPHPVLSPGVVEQLEQAGVPAQVVCSLNRSGDEVEALLGAAAQTYVWGYGVRPAQVGNRAELPFYPFQKKRYWLETRQGREGRLGGRPHPLVARHDAHSLDECDHSFVLDYDLRRHPWLADHRVQDAIVVPGTCHMEALCACANIAFDAAMLEGVRFERALLLDPDIEPPDVRVTVRGDQGRFALQSLVPDTTTWMTHVSGWMRHRGERPKPLNLPARSDGPVLDVDVPAFLERARQQGLQYGPAFRGMTAAAVELRDDGGRIEVRAELPSELEHDADGYLAHPALLDALLQGLLTLPFLRDESTVWLPHRVGQVVQGPGRGLATRARIALVRRAPRIVADLQVTNDAGDVLVELRDCVVQRLDGAGEPTGLRVHEEWSSLELPDGKPGYCRLVGEDELVREALVSRGWRVDDAGSADPDVLLIAVPEPSEAGLQAIGQQVLEPLIGRARQFSQRPFPGRVFLLTRSAQRVRSSDVPSLGAAAAWGLGRVLINEFPQLAVGLVDLPGAPLDEDLDALARVLAAPPEHDLAVRVGEVLQMSLMPGEGPARGVPALASRTRFRTRIATPGLLESAYLVPLPTTQLLANQVEIAVHAAGVNFRDLMGFMGLLSGEMLAGDLGPEIPGLEVGGVVTRVGAEVQSLAVGDEVMAFASDTFASHVIVPEVFAVRKPGGIDFAEAASSLVVFGTSWYSLTHLAHLGHGDTLLVHSGTGGVGQAAIQIARLRGAEIFTSAGSEERRQYLRAQGIEHVMDSRSADFVQYVRDHTGGRGVDIVLNALAEPGLSRSLACVAPNGHFVEIGKTELYGDRAVGLRPFTQGISFHSFDLHRLSLDRPELVRRRVIEPVVDLLAEGKLQALPTSRFHISEVAAALRHMAAVKHRGKVVLEVDDRLPIEMIDPKPQAARKDRCYLVTGGTRGLGLYLGGWLLRCGAGHVVLAGRSGDSHPETRAELERLRSIGFSVEARAVDVSDSRAVASLLRRLGSLPLGGVMHCATVVDDALLGDLSQDGLHRNLAAKAGGALALHDALGTLPQQPEHVVFVSSVSAVIGNPGQGAYNAANALLEALVEQRRARALPGLALRLGAVGEVGMVARDERLGALLDDAGLAPVAPRDVALQLQRALRTGHSQPLVVRADWRRASRSASSQVARSRLTVLDQLAQSDQPRADASAVLGRLLALPTDARYGAVVSRLQAMLGAILGEPAEDIPLDVSLTKLGIDSLMVTQLRNQVLLDFSVDLPMMQVLKGPPAQEVAHMVLAGIGSEDSASAPVQESPRDDSSAVEAGDAPITFQLLHELPESLQRSYFFERDRYTRKRSGYGAGRDHYDEVSHVIAGVCDGRILSGMRITVSPDRASRLLPYEHAGGGDGVDYRALFAAVDGSDGRVAELSRLFVVGDDPAVDMSNRLTRGMLRFIVSERKQEKDLRCIYWATGGTMLPLFLSALQDEDFVVKHRPLPDALIPTPYRKIAAELEGAHVICAVIPEVEAE